MKYLIQIILLFTPLLLLSQSVVITNVERNLYPAIRLDYIILDANNTKTIPQSSELKLFENGLEQGIVNNACDVNISPEPISVVITIDNSSSMREMDGTTETRDKVIRDAAKRYIDILNPQSEVAITYFSTESKLLQPFSSDKLIAKTAIDNIPEPFGSTYINNSFLNPTDGNFKALENAKYKKVIVFLTDGVSNDVELTDILNRAFADDVTIFTMSIYTNMDEELITIADSTGGVAFDNIVDKEYIERVFRALALLTSGVESCNLTYISKLCETVRDIELVYKENSKDEKKIIIPRNQLVEYSISPRYINLPNNGSLYSIHYSNIVSNKDSLIISKIESQYGNLLIEEPLLSDFPIRLDKGERLRIKLKVPSQDEPFIEVVKIQTNSCEDNDILLKYNNSVSDLAVELPNGSEQFYVGSDETTSWQDVIEESKYDLSYSTNAGYNWKTITKDYNAKDFPWENIPDEPTNEALFKVTRHSDNQSPIVTKNVGVLDTNFGNKFEKILALEDGNFLVTSSFRDYFQYRTLYVDTTGQQPIERSRTRKLLMKLDENLDVLDYNIITSDYVDYSLASIDNNIYIFLKVESYLILDTLNYPKLTSTSYNALIVKLDANLEYINYKELLFPTFLTSGSNYKIDFKSSEDKLHLLGMANRTLIYDKQKIIDLDLVGDLTFIARLDSDLNFEDIVYWQKDADKMDIMFNGIIPTTDDSVVIWGVGTGTGYFNMDSSYIKVFALKANYENNKLEIKNYIAYDESVDFSIFDYKTYNNYNYYLINTNDTTYYNNEQNYLGSVDSRNRILAITDDNDLKWEKELDNFSTKKKLEFYNLNQILVVGYTNESFRLGDSTILRNANVHFVGSYNLFDGEFNWAKYIYNSLYSGNIVVNKDLILTSGEIYSKVNFGEGFIKELDYENNETNKQYLWLLKEKNINNFDVSDSLWSISKPAFEYIDTIDFGKVYIGTKKDSLVVDFITKLNNDNITIEAIKIDDFRFTSDFKVPVILKENIDITFGVESNQTGITISKGTIVTSQGDYSFYLKVNELDDQSLLSYNGKLIIDFGDVDVSKEKTEGQWVVRNKGEALIGIDSVVIVGDENNEFKYEITTDKNYVLSKDSLFSNFTYAPKLAGISEAEVHFYLDVIRKPIVATLKGNGISRDTLRLKVLIDSTSSFPDKLANIATRLEIADNPTSLDMKSLEVDIEYNATLLLPYRLTNEGTVTNKVRKLTFEFDENQIKALSVDKRFLVTIGNSVSTEIKIVDVRAYNSKEETIESANIIKQNGLFTLDGICFADGSYRLYEPRNPTSLNIRTENNNYVAIFNLVEKGETNLSVFDINGKLVTTILTIELEQGEHKTGINTDNISSGTYFIQLETTTEIISKVFTISK